MKQLKTALIGYGYWGQNIARVLFQSPAFKLEYICDSRQTALEKASRLYPTVTTVREVSQLPADVEVVAIITPASTHYELAKLFLESGKHVLLTKPFVKSFCQAEDLIRVANSNNVTCFVDHTFVFHPAVRKMKELLPRIGTPYFISGQRLNLGLYQADVNVIYDLLPHDLSIISYLFEEPLLNASTKAFKTAGLPQEDLAHCSFGLNSGVKALVTVSWLSPAKVRQFFIVGSKGMLLYDDTAVTEKVKLFDRGISVNSVSDIERCEDYTSRISYRNGDLFCPQIASYEALGFEMEEFSRAINDIEIRHKYTKLNLDIMESLELATSHIEN